MGIFGVFLGDFFGVSVFFIFIFLLFTCIGKFLIVRGWMGIPSFGYIKCRTIIDRVPNMVIYWGEWVNVPIRWNGVGAGYLRPLSMFGPRMGNCNDGSIDTCTNVRICHVSFKWNPMPQLLRTV